MAGGLSPAQLDALEKQSKQPTPAPTGGGLTPAQLDALSKGAGSGGSKPVAPPPTAAPTPTPTVPRAQAQKPVIPAGRRHEAAGIEDRLRSTWSWLTDKGTDVATGILGAPQRAVGGAVFGIEQHQQPLQVLKQIWSDATHVDIATQARDTESIRAALHAPTHDQIDAFVKQHVPHDMRPYASGILKAGEDVMLQTLSDPLTYVGGLGLWAKGVRGAMRGASTVQAMMDVAARYGMKSAFPGLKQAAEAYQGALAFYGKWFHVRPELDQFFSPSGKAARLQIEKQTKQELGALRVRPQDVADDDTAKKLYLQMIFDHGSPKASKDAAQYLAGANVKVTRGKLNATGSMLHAGNVQSGIQDFMEMTPEERAAKLNSMAGDTEKGEIARRTEEYVKQHPEALRSGGTQIPNYRKIPTESKPIFGAQGNKLIEQGTDWFRKLNQASVYLNPFPHGLANVGQLMYLAGGMHVVPEALKYMAYALARDTGRVAKIPGADRIGASFEKDVQRLRSGGAVPDYTSGAFHSIWSSLPGWKQIAGPMQKALEEMEIGWRVSRLRQLDRTLGPSKSAKDELLKMRTVEEAVGDYENQNAFVELLKAMGGPWVAFHMGIVPRALLKAVKEHPERVLLLARIQDALQQQRSGKGQKDSLLKLPGSPLRAITNPVAYGSGPASFGLVEGYKKFVESLDYEPFGRAVAEQAQRFNPFGDWLRVAVDAASGAGMPGPRIHGHDTIQKPQTMTDHLITAMLETLGGYYMRQQSAAAKRAQQREEKSKAKYRAERAKEPWWTIFQ